MSIPPQLIRVKRKRDDDVPVTFLQFDKEAKRHRSESHWVYQRREAGPLSPNNASTKTPRHCEPVIHVSSPDRKPSPSRKHAAQDATPSKRAEALEGVPSQTQNADKEKPVEPRRFHISKKMMVPRSQSPGAGVSKKVRYGPAVFVERNKTKVAQKTLHDLDAPQKQVPEGSKKPGETEQMAMDKPVEERRLKKPGIASRGRSPQPESTTRAPLPTSVMNPHDEDMAKITADMNDWVLREIGAQLQAMEQEKQSAPSKFKPKAPAQRYQERHPETAPAVVAPDNEVDIVMSDPSDMDDDDWIIDEYVRIPAHAMMPDVAPADIGLLVLDGEEDNNLFYGPEHDEEDDLDEDEEDENAENYYTADYPEDEVESDDEYGRHPYCYRNTNASDDEEYDNDFYDDMEDEMIVEGDNDDARMARIGFLMKRSRAFQ